MTATKHSLNEKVAEAKVNDYCVVQNIGTALDELMTSFENRNVELTDLEIDKLDDILYYLMEGVGEYEEMKEWEDRYERLKDCVSDAIHSLEYEL